MCSMELQRLSTFVRWPVTRDDLSAFQEDRKFLSKLAGAHFQRTADCVEDEVKCLNCGVGYSGWSTDSLASNGKLHKSPASVHRVISRKCPALNPSNSEELELIDLKNQILSRAMGSPFAEYLPSHLQAGSMTPERSESSTHLQTQSESHRPRVRRVLFPESPEPNQQHQQDDQQAPLDTESEQGTGQSTPQPRLMDQASITHPVKPKSGDYDHHFASVRLLTFPSPVSCAKYQAWAEEGFIYRREQQDVMCVYCGTVLVANGHHPKVVHARECPSCPFVMGIDVGNISQEQEKFIRLDYFKQQAKKQSDLDLTVIKHVHYQKEEERLLTFQGWPKVYAKIFPAAAMAEAGFFYTGHSDKVCCYHCGVGLFGWEEGADVWTTHATVSPACLHVINAKGQHFIAQAADLQVQAEVKHHNDSSACEASSSGGVVGKEPGSPVLDMAAVKAALACGYTLPKIQHAIVMFFSQTSRYPNEAILKAALKGTDENHITICRQQQVVLQRETELMETRKQMGRVVQEKDTQLQETRTHLQEKDTQLQRVVEEKDTQLQRVVEEKDTQLQRVVQEKDSQLQRVVEEKDQTVQTLQNQLDNSVTQLSEQEQMLRLQDQQIQSLMRQVQQLRADRQHREPQDAAAGGAMNEAQSLVCRICQSDRPRMIFLPCGHLFSCAQCTSRLPDKRCPVCRQDIADVLPAFVA